MTVPAEPSTAERLVSLSPAYVDRFALSMPRAYRAAHDRSTIVEHARVVADRGARPANAGLVACEEVGQATLCVVADDRPGVLATISAALMMEGFDVIDAEVHTRQRESGRAEAVDLFWVRRAEPEDRARPITPADMESLREVLCSLFDGTRTGTPSAIGLPHASETVVRFVEGAGGALVTLEVETDDQSGLLHALSQTLFEQGVQIAESEVRTMGGRVYDRFHIHEVDGSAIAPARRLQIQVAVLAAVQPRRGAT
jgi:[protein-PII] uridylyltransferase